MTRVFQCLRFGLCLGFVLAAMPVSSQTTVPEPIFESTSSGLFTFAQADRAVRVAAAFAATDTAVVPTLVRFLDQGNNVLKEVRGTLAYGTPVVAELARSDVAGRGDLFVRVEVVHKLPGVRREVYSILVSTQSIGPTGSGNFVWFLPGGTCGFPTIPLPDGAVPSRPVVGGSHVMCKAPAFTAF